MLVLTLSDGYELSYDPRDRMFSLCKEGVTIAKNEKQLPLEERAKRLKKGNAKFTKIPFFGMDGGGDSFIKGFITGIDLEGGTMWFSVEESRHGQQRYRVTIPFYKPEKSVGGRSSSSTAYYRISPQNTDVLEKVKRLQIHVKDVHRQIEELVNTLDSPVLYDDFRGEKGSGE